MATQVTELTVHHDLHVEEAGASSSSDKTITNDRINLDNPLTGMNATDKYTFSYRVFVPLPFSIIVLASYWSPSGVAAIVYNSIILLSCVLAMIICGICYKTNLKKSLNTLFGFQSNDVASDYAVYDSIESREYAGFALVITAIYSSLYAIIEEVDFAHSNISSMQMTVHGRTCFIAMCLLCVMFLKTVKCHQEIEQQKQSVLTKYPATKAMDERVTQRLKECKDSQRFSNRKLELAVIFVVVFCFNYIGTALYKYKIWAPGLAFFIASTIVFVTDSMMYSMIIYSLHSVAFGHRSPSIIMEELGSPIYSTTINDLIGWWELRKFYSHCIVNIYVSSSSIIGVTLLGCIILVCFTFGGFIREPTRTSFDNISLIVYTFYVLSLALVMTSNAANYHAHQLLHVNMLNKELMYLECGKNEQFSSIKDMELAKHENERQRYIVDRMIQDVQHNSDVISVFGISIGYKFMLFLRASVTTVVVAILSIILQ